MQTDLSKLVSVNDFEEEAIKRMTKNANSYINSGANHQLALHENISKFRFVKLNPRVLIDVTKTDTSTTLLGKKVSIPFGIAPTAMHCLAHPLGELNTVRSSVTHNTVMCCSTLATKGIDEISNAAFTHFTKLRPKNNVDYPKDHKYSPIPTEYLSECTPLSPAELERQLNGAIEGKPTYNFHTSKNTVICPKYDYPIEKETQFLTQPHLWFQLYLTTDRSITLGLINLARSMGFQALVITVDAPVLGKRERDQRGKFTLPKEYKLENLMRFSDKMTVTGDKEEGSGLLKLFASKVDKRFTWEDLDWIKSVAKGMEVVVKGIQCEEDALLCGKF